MVEQTGPLARGRYPAAPVQRGPAAAPATTLTPKQILGMVRRHVLLIISFTMLGVIGGGVAWFLLLRYYPKYTASTFIEVLSPGTTDPTQISAQLPQKDISYQFRVSMAALIKEQSKLQELLQNDKIRQTQWYDSFNTDVQRIKELEENLIASPQRESQYIKMAMTCGDSKEAALVVNEMMRLFLNSRRVSTEGEIEEKLTQLRNQQAKLQDDLDFAEQQLNEIRKTSGMTMLGMDQQWRHTQTTKLADLEVRKNELETDISRIEAILGTYQERLQGPVGVQDQRRLETDPVMITLAQRLSSLEAQLASQMRHLGEDHRSVRQTQEAIRQTKQERVQRLRELGELERMTNYRNAQDQLVTLQKEMEVLEQNRARAEERQKELDAWNAVYAQRVTIREQIKEQLNQIKEQVTKYEILHSDPDTPKVQSMGRAPEPLRVSSPRWEFYFPGGTVLGLLAGVGLCFAVELLNDKVRTPTDVTRHLRAALLGLVCHAEDDEDAEDVDLCHVVRQAPYSMTSECYRRLRANLELSCSAEKLKSVFVTSPSAGDGKTCTAVNLATALVAQNKKVLLIDANFRRPSSTTLFPRPQSGSTDSESESENERDTFCGLSNMLAGQCNYEAAVRSSGIERLNVIDSGPLPPNPAELLSSSRVKSLLERSRAEYDHVIIDGPPILLVSEAKLIAAQVDSSVLVINALRTRRGTAQRAIRELRQSAGNLSGCVLFAARAMKGGYFRELFRSYQDYQKAELAASAK